MRVIAQGLADRSHVGKTFEAFVQTVYPFATQVKEETDKKMMEAVAKEVAKGPISFQPISNNILASAAKKYTMADNDMQRIRKAASQRKVRK